MKTDKIRASISFNLNHEKNWRGKIKDDSIIIGMNIKNYCDESLVCWCNANATCCDEKVKIGGFYDHEHSFDLQPFSNGHGWLQLSRYVDIDRMRKVRTDENRKQQFRMNVEFTYQVFDAENNKIVEKVYHNVPLKLFYDFKRNKLIADY